jgi:amino acid transporter
MYARFTNQNQPGLKKPGFFKNNPKRQQGKIGKNIMWALLIIPLLSIIGTVSMILSVKNQPQKDTTPVTQMENHSTTTAPIQKTPEAPTTAPIEFNSDTPIADRIESGNAQK